MKCVYICCDVYDVCAYSSDESVLCSELQWSRT